MYLNKAIVIGNLTRDPELRSMPSGAKVTSFSVATNRVWKDKNGERKEAVEYHNIVVFGRQAETTAQYLKKGSSCLVEGRMQTRSWDNQEGQKKYRTEIVADRVQFGPRTGGDGGSKPTPNSTNSNNEENNTSKEMPSADDIDTIEYPDDEDVEDIPF